jgi:hypothetical protein
MARLIKAEWLEHPMFISGRRVIAGVTGTFSAISLGITAFVLSQLSIAAYAGEHDLYDIGTVGLVCLTCSTLLVFFTWLVFPRRRHGEDDRLRTPLVEMTRKSEALLIIVAIPYLTAGLMGSFFPTIVIATMFGSRSWSTFGRLFRDGWYWWALRVAAVGPCFAIAYGFLRRRRWGWYLLIAYNLCWLVYLAFVLVGMAIDERQSTLAAWSVFLVVFLILSGLICLMFQKDVKVLKAQ